MDKDKDKPKSNVVELRIKPKDLRLANDLSQIEFWARVGITQSGGSRYENGSRSVPPSLQSLLRLTYVEHVDLKDVTRDTVEVARLLKQEHPEEYEKLLKEVKSRRKI